jgi:hypothetical protein
LFDLGYNHRVILQFTKFLTSFRSMPELVTNFGREVMSASNCIIKAISTFPEYLVDQDLMITVDELRTVIAGILT